MNKVVFLQGKCKWCRTEKVDQYGKWKVLLYPTEESLEEIKQLKELGLKNHLKKDEDGYCMYFSRDAQKTIKNKVIAFQPPEIFHSDGTTPMKDVYIGNGSDVTLKLEVYSYGYGDKKGIAARWVSARVDNLVPFEVKRDFTETQKERIEGLPDRPVRTQVTYGD